MGVEEVGRVYSPCSGTYEGLKDEVSEPCSLPPSPASSGRELCNTVARPGSTLPSSGGKGLWELKETGPCVCIS